MKKTILLAAICTICTQAHSQWSLTGNAGTNSSTNFIGTTDNVNFKIRTKNNVRMTITAGGKIGIGITLPVFKLDVKGGSINTDSVYRIKGNTVLSFTGMGNIFGGPASGNSVSSGDYNTGYGLSTLAANTTGQLNTAVGAFALIYNSNSSNNTALGVDALHNGAGGSNTAVGSQAMQNASGAGNTAVGALALVLNTGSSNTGVGHSALYYGGGSGNTAVGVNAGNNNGTTTVNFTAIGYYAGHINSNPNTIEIGNNSVGWIGGQQNWSTYSDRRIKDNIQSNVPGLSFITKLNPVTYNLNIHRQNEICNISDTAQWEGKYDIERITQTGFLAQEVEQAAKEVNYDFNGVKAPHGNAKLYSVQYASFVVPLVKAVQEIDLKINKFENLKIENETLKTEAGKLKSEMESQKAEMEMIKSVLSDDQQQKLKSLRDSRSASGGSEGLDQNYPNPFNTQTEIKFRLPVKYNSAQLIITDATGKQVRSHELQNASSVIIKASELSAGTYSYSLIIDGVTIDSKQMVLTK